MPFVTQGRQDRVVRDGKAYTYRRQVAVCGKCGAEIPFAPYDEAAAEALEAAVASGVGLATPEQIRQLPLKYAIGKRPLSRLLGWGELTYTRLLDGRSPNAAHSAEIVHLLNSPAAYARVLEIGHEKGQITGVAYEKSRRAVDALLAESAEESGETGNPLKAFAVADRLCALADGDLTPRMLQTLMRLVQKASLEDGGTALFEAPSRKVDWGYEYPQIAAAYSFADIQASAERLRNAVTANDKSTEPNGTEAADSPDGGEAAATPEQADATEAAEVDELTVPVDDPGENPKASKKGKKGKKGKKDKKSKKKAKDKKAKRAQELGAATVVEAEAEAAAVSVSASEAISASALAPKRATAAKRQGPLSPAECQLIDDVFARYKSYLEAGLARSFR